MHTQSYRSHILQIPDASSSIINVMNAALNISKLSYFYTLTMT